MEDCGSRAESLPTVSGRGNPTVCEDTIGDEKKVESNSGLDKVSRDRIRKLSRQVSLRWKNGSAKESWWNFMSNRQLCKGNGGCGFGRVSILDVQQNDSSENDESWDERSDDELLQKEDNIVEDPLFICNASSTFLVSVVITYLVLGAMIYMGLEGWEPKEAFYFVIVTLTTVGYGDLHPHSDFGKLFTMVYAVFGIVIVFRLIAWLMRRILDKHEDFLAKVGTDEDGTHTAEQIHARRTDELKKRWLNTFVFCSVLMGMYILVGTLYWRIKHNLTIVTSMYLVMTTLTTIGYGDVSPHDLLHGALLFSSFYVTTGVCIFAYVASKMAEVHLDYLQNERRGKILLQRLSRERIRHLMKYPLDILTNYRLTTTFTGTP